MNAAGVVRRGPIRVVLAGPPLEPPNELRSRIDELWEEERRLRPGLVDGTMISVSAVEGDRVVTRPCAYRLFVARERDAALRERLGVRALGVSGVLLIGGDRGERSVVLGCRSADVTEYGGAWELVPSGGIEPERAGADGIVDVEAALFAELEEEAGLRRSDVLEAVLLGLVHDIGQDGYDVCLALHVREDAKIRLAEYEEHMVLPAKAAVAWLDGGDRAVVPTSRALLELAEEAALL
jgi:8-oxo-dGTP pyrophosphatase MutT (NUDIX family)